MHPSSPHAERDAQTLREWANANNGAMNVVKIVVGALLGALAAMFVAGSTWVMLTQRVEAQGVRIERLEKHRASDRADIDRVWWNGYLSCLGGARTGAYPESQCEKPPQR